MCLHVRRESRIRCRANVHCGRAPAAHVHFDPGITDGDICAGLLSASAASNEERELASIVEIGAEQIARLVDDVLDAATIQSGAFELALHPFDVRSSVESCIGLVSDAAGAKGLDLSFQAAGHLSFRSALRRRLSLPRPHPPGRCAW